MKRFHEIHNDYHIRERKQRVSIEENGKKYIANNVKRKEVIQYHTDTERASGKRCDYALYIFDEENEHLDDDRVILIELKGSDIRHAIEQISSTINTYIKQHKRILNPRRVDARVVAARVPNPKFYNTNEIRLKKILKEYRGTFKIHTIKAEETI